MGWASRANVKKKEFVNTYIEQTFKLSKEETYPFLYKCNRWKKFKEINEKEFEKISAIVNEAEEKYKNKE